MSLRGRRRSGVEVRVLGWFLERKGRLAVAIEDVSILQKSGWTSRVYGASFPAMCWRHDYEPSQW